MIHAKASLFAVLGAVTGLVASFPAGAALDAISADTILFTATSDAAPGTATITLHTNEDHVATSLGFANGTAPQTNFDLKGLKDGIVLFVASGKNAAILRSDNFDPANGGTLVLDYIYNGVSGERRTFICELDRTGTSWAMSVNENSGRRVFHALFLKAKKMLGTTVGIASISILNRLFN